MSRLHNRRLQVGYRSIVYGNVVIRSLEEMHTRVP